MTETKVAVLMGSDSDFGIMIKAKEVLDKFGVACEMRITSAHRTPRRTRSLVHDLEKRGCEIFICGAGMAAHLAGAVAAQTVKFVIGVPLTSKASPMNGIDALYSTVQMPSGMPVATVAIDGAKNAAWLAVQVLALNNKALTEELIVSREGAVEEIESADEVLQQKLRAEALFKSLE